MFLSAKVKKYRHSEGKARRNPVCGTRSARPPRRLMSITTGTTEESLLVSSFGVRSPKESHVNTTLSN
ncbi:MAG TPA: hypothetical protein PK325_13755 [Cyclobacteriaceae bacterium]|nr:hypothetical protein [Cyclobacteriaceae bacterium]HMV10858.1 hypothetical protein [Cyclobacteriaceae bacterium]HMV91713.1 hypothetical protein [Cyclobacteriaceae bacterium]HMW99701.1 hypothetical protein [Cyclobacteriaceae bacterium]HMX51981.1 hypothetical protein [Cyclobacteriaceae bacterium]